MKQKLIILSIVLLFTSVIAEAQSQRGVRIGYIDMEYILESVPEYQEALVQLDGRVQRWRKDMDDMQKDIDQMKLNLSNERVLLTRELIEEREEDIKIKEDQLFDYQQSRFGPNGDLIIQRRQLVQPIQDQVFNAVQEIASNRQYDFIFDKSADVVMLYAAERNDISDQVIRIINRAARRTQAESREDRRDIEARDGLSDEQESRLSEREQMRLQRLAEREAVLEERRRVRDSIQSARQVEIEARRQGRQDDGDNIEENPSLKSGDSESGTTNATTSEAPTREQVLAERKRVQDSIRVARLAEQEARRLKIQQERQQRQDSILKARSGNNTPPQSQDDDGDGSGFNQ